LKGEIDLIKVNYDAYLEKVLDFIKITDKEIEEAKKWVRIIKEGFEELEGDSLVVETTGSYDRNTAICPIHDVDLFFIMQRSKYTDKIPELISLFAGNTHSVVMKNKEKLTGSKTGPGISVIPAEHGIIIKYPRDEPRFMMDLVLAFPDANKEDQYIIPDENKWIKTSKAEHISAIKDANIKHSGQATKYIKLFKYWNILNRKVKKREGLKPLKSFFLEKLILDNLPPAPVSLTAGITHLFEKLSEEVTNRKYQQLGPGGEPISDRELKRRSRSKVLLEGDSKHCSDDKWQEIFKLPY